MNILIRLDFHALQTHTLTTKSFKKESALTSAERMKFRPMFNLSSKKAAQTPLESTFPLRRHYKITNTNVEIR